MRILEVWSWRSTSSQTLMDSSLFTSAPKPSKDTLHNKYISNPLSSKITKFWLIQNKKKSFTNTLYTTFLSRLSYGNVMEMLFISTIDKSYPLKAVYFHLPSLQSYSTIFHGHIMQFLFMHKTGLCENIPKRLPSTVVLQIYLNDFLIHVAHSRNDNIKNISILHDFMTCD